MDNLEKPVSEVILPPTIIFEPDPGSADNSERAKLERERLLKEGLPVNDLDDFIRGLPKEPPADPPPAKPVETLLHTEFNQNDRCDTTSVFDGTSFSEIGAFAPNANTLWPGSIVRGESLKGGILTAIGLKRSPLTLTIKNLGNAANIPVNSVVVKNPNVDSVETATRRLVNEAVQTGVAPIIFQAILEYRSTEHAGTQLHAQASNMFGQVRAAFESSSDVTVNNLAMFFQQRYYDVTTNTFANPGDLFDRGIFGTGIGGVTANDLAQAISSHPVMPAYISTVSFGRILSLSVSTKLEAKQSRVVLDAAVSGLLGSGSISSDIVRTELFQKSEFRLLILGGPAPTLLRLPGPEAAKQLVEEWNKGIVFTKDTPAVPISYVTNWLGDFTVAQINLTTTFKRFICSSQKIIRLGARFSTVNDNKEKGEFIGLRFYLGSKLLREINPIPQSDYEFPENSEEPGPDPYVGGVPNWYSFPINDDTLTADQCKNLKVAVIKSNGNAGWNFRLTAAMFLEDQKGPREFIRTDVERMGDDFPNFRVFDANNC